VLIGTDPDRAGQSTDQFTLLFGFPVRPVLAAVRAELFHFKTLGGRLLVLSARVVPVLAFLALERDDLSRHSFSPAYYRLNMRRRQPRSVSV
jgi:hypothetical protein